MFNWLSDYNYDYALAAVPIQLILLVFYCSRRNLPIRSSYSFLWVMVANLVMTVFDIVACEMNEVWTEYPMWVMYGVNQLYFLAFIARGWALFDYTAEECHAYTSLGKWMTKLSVVPALVTSALVLSTAWTAAIFQFAPGKGYFNTGFYNSIYACMWFYIGMSLLCVFLRWKHIETRLKTSMLEFNAVLIVGILLRKMFVHTLVTSYFSILAILLIYLTAQNPDLYREKKTHLFNRDAFNRIGAECIMKGTPFHCIVASVNNYNSIKTLYGYQQMKQSMELCGKWLIESFPKYYVFYFRNGEFLLLQKGHHFRENKEYILQVIKNRFSKPWRPEGLELQLDMSALVLPYHMLPKNMTKVHDFIVHTFNHAYVENHKGNYVVTQHICDGYDREGIIELALGKALEEKRIETWFQPIYSVQKDAIVGAEALARLRDPEMGYIPPDEFIRVAERSGEIMEVGRQVFARVCEYLATGYPDRLGIKKINVNLSPAQCMNDQLASELTEIAKQYGVSMDKINFEITESSLSDYQLIQKQMLQLQKQGATFSLDDFGTGTSNLIRLLNLPIRAVKLDIYMVRTYFNEKSGILPDLVSMFRKAKLHIVAEGVETLAMKETLARMGCDYEQGYYFSKPLPPGEFTEYLKRPDLEMT